MNYIDSTMSTGRFFEYLCRMDNITEESDNIELFRRGEWANGFAEEFSRDLVICEEKCFEFNSLPPSRKDERRAIIRGLFRSTGEKFNINPPFHCDFGYNISIGNDFVGNFNLVILDEAEVTIGSNVFIGPNVSLCTIIHSLETGPRNRGIMRARPITICDNVWIASNVVVLPGIIIGEGAVIGAGSVVSKDVEPYTLAVGNPCRKIKDLPR